MRKKPTKNTTRYLVPVKTDNKVYIIVFTSDTNVHVWDTVQLNSFNITQCVKINIETYICIWHNFVLSSIQQCFFVFLVFSKRRIIISTQQVKWNRDGWLQKKKFNDLKIFCLWTLKFDYSKYKQMLFYNLSHTYHNKVDCTNYDCVNQFSN